MHAPGGVRWEVSRSEASSLQECVVSQKPVGIEDSSREWMRLKEAI